MQDILFTTAIATEVIKKFADLIKAGGYRGRTQLLNLILALGYIIRIACRENYE